MTLETRLLRESWALAQPVAGKVTAHFYGMLFSRHPAVRALFPVAMDVQRDRLLHALTHVIANLDDLPAVTERLAALARDHRKYGVQPEHYALVGNCLLASLRANLESQWTAEYEEAWRTAYAVISQIMIDAAAADTSPAIWAADVIAHHQPTPDIAVITVSPEQPYPFQAGHHATLQTSRWPRVWRPYSIANAPREDNTLTFHVRVVPGGWVSTALARHTKVGDRITLGPPRGTLTPPAHPPRFLVCAAGGTGLAPLKAILEESARTPHPPPATLIHGARRRDELYDIEDLQLLAAAHGRLQLVTPLSEEPSPTSGLSTADALKRLDLDDAAEIYLCGPDEMVTASRKTLADLGVDERRIHLEENSLA